MIQRIQSLFLLVVTILMAVVLLQPIGIFKGDFNGSQYFLMEASNVNTLMMIEFPLWILKTLVIAVLVVSVVALLLFKKRNLQVILSIIGIVLLAATYGTVLAYVNTINSQLSSVFHSSPIMSFPGISMALFLLAIIFIKKDDKLVKSTDRIR